MVCDLFHGLLGSQVRLMNGHYIHTLSSKILCQSAFRLFLLWSKDFYFGRRTIHIECEKVEVAKKVGLFRAHGRCHNALGLPFATYRYVDFHLFHEP